MLILYIEELKAIMRGRFAWLGAAVILLAIGGVATVGTQDTWLDGYGIIAYGLVPLAFIPLAAVAIASPRANRFVESVFTAPVERCDWLIAKILVLATLAASYYVALVPMQLVYTHHVGLPFLLGRFLRWTPGIMIASIAIGTLIGVLFIGRSIAAPAAAGMGVLLAYVGLVPLQELMVARAMVRRVLPHCIREPRSAPQECARVHAGCGQHSGQHRQDVAQSSSCRHRCARPSSLDIPEGARSRDMGSHSQPALDDCVCYFRNSAASGHARRYEL